MKKEQDSNEMFSETSGKKFDAHLHNPILKEGDGEAEKVGYEQAKKMGLSQEQLAKLYPKA